MTCQVVFEQDLVLIDFCVRISVRHTPIDGGWWRQEKQRWAIFYMMGAYRQKICVAKMFWLDILLNSEHQDQVFLPCSVSVTLTTITKINKDHCNTKNNIYRQ